MEEKNINEIGAAEQHGIKKLTDYQHLRLRTETYLGARTLHEQPVILFSDLGPLIDNEGWVPALMTSFREIIDNSLDEFTKANIKGVLNVTYSEKHLAFEVRDNGRGIPLDWDANHGCHLATLVMSHLKAGRNFVDTERKGVAGMNGLGGSAITNVSSTFEISVVRTGQPNAAPTNDDLKYKGNWHFQQKFTEGNELFGDELQIHNPVVQRTTSTAIGTTIRFQLSPEVFKVRSLPTKLVESLLREIAVANPQHKITFNNSKLPTGSVEKILFPKHKCIPLHISEEGFKSTFYVVPNVDGANGLLHSLVNNIPTYDTGNHLDTFKRIFALSLIRNLEKESKRKKLKPNRGDIEEGLLIYNHTVMDGPYFQSQAKTKLINDEVIKPIERAMSDEWFQELIKKNKAWIDEIYARCMIRTSSKDADELTRAAKKNLRSKVAKLRDATEKHNRTKCKLFVTEGDSSIGGLLEVRDPTIHGGLPLRGKILNVSDGKMTGAKLLASQSTADIMNALGLEPGVKADRDTLRYGQFMIATDADEDGKNIAALVINFLYTFWPELFDPELPAFVHIFMTPFIILEKGKTREYFYQDNYMDYNPEDWKGWASRRAKGLGTLQKPDWNHAVNINLRALPILDDGNLKETLDLIFNKDRADDRKVWLTGGQND